MFLSASLFGLVASVLRVSAQPATPLSNVTAPSHPLLEWSPTAYVPDMVPAFQAKIDWDLDNNHTIQTPSGLRASWWSREGYWYDPQGNPFGEILRANDDGIVTPGTTPGTRYLELVISYVVKLDDGYWAYVKHTGSAIVREYQNGIVRVETDSPKYTWLNRIDFVAPGSFNQTEVMTVNHYFPTGYNLPNGPPGANATLRH